MARKEFHGMSNTPEYRAWINMIERCEYNAPGYKAVYQDKGIRVCEQWRKSFVAFFSHVGHRPTPNHSLDRIISTGHYEPGNVRWATNVVQSRNVMRNRIVTIRGKSMTLAEAAEGAPVPYNTILYRLKRGWTIERAISRAAHKGLRP